MYALEYTHVVNELDSYTVYSEPVTITVEAPTVPENLIAIIAISILILLVGIFTVVFISRRNKTR